MEQQAVDKNIPFDNEIDDDEDDGDNSSSNNDEMMPPLETIEKEMNHQSDKKKKNIVIPDDNDSKKKSKEEKVDDNDGYLDILNNGDLRKKTIKKGDNVRPQRGSKVIIKLETRLYADGCDDDDQDVGTGKLIEGETFDRFTLIIGDNDLHQSLDLLIPLMELHEVCRAIIKSRFAYGQSGNKNIGIPEDATLDCQIELLEIPNPSDNVFGQGDDDEAESIANKELLDERLRFGNYKKTRGNFWFERGEYSMAIQCYKGALKYLDANNQELKLIDNDNENSGEDKQLELVDKINDLIDKRAQTFNNLAAAQMKMDAFDTALRSVNDSLLLRPNNVKALFRHAKILSEKGDIEDAIKDLKKASTIDPQSEAIQMELNRLNKILIKQINDQKELYRRMLQVKNDDTKNNQTKKSKHSNSNNKDNSNNHQQQSLWYRYRWPVAISFGMVTTAAILIQSFVYSSTK
uniref:peptidylprolyl isomerase n=1 Tax=Dermatophagoides pteronyssinus TaxID=6956 RepID=A0A6P6XN56_DERPT|nr:peptidyl-prolyl cis-trans isomerase FKBP8-like [Dermatophagoides pteronyssinus]